MNSPGPSPLEQVASCRDVPDQPASAAPAFEAGAKPGETLDDRFLLKDIINRGGMATIFKAEDLHDHRRIVAVKVPHVQYESSPTWVGRFQREEEIGTRLHHPYILQVLPVGAAKKRRPYIVSEYLNGCTLAHLLDRMKPLPEADALKIASLVCEALQYLHEQGVIHRDLKPGNIMICRDKTIRLMDFGISQFSESRRMTFAGFTNAMGTPDYMAPEQITGRRGDARTDVYSLGAVLYEMLTGKRPFEGDDPFVIMNTRTTGDPVAPRQLNPQLSPQAEEIILRAMRRDPDERYQSAAAMKEDLDAPGDMVVTGLSRNLQTSTLGKRALLMVRWIALWCLLPVAVQVILFLLLWYHYSHKR